MKKAMLLMIIYAAVIVVTGTVFAQSERTRVPRVDYTEPANQSTVDLTGKTALAFRWKGSPTPGGGREAYRFRLYKGLGYETILSQDLKPDLFSVEVPADKFEDGATYSWHVQQRDASNMWWGLFDTWSFKVSKKK